MASRYQPFILAGAKISPRIDTKFKKFKNQVNTIAIRHKFFFFFCQISIGGFSCVTKKYRIMIKKLYFLFGL
jgi:hypothetical protein